MEVKYASDLISDAWTAVEDSKLPKTPELQAAALAAVIQQLARPAPSGGARGTTPGQAEPMAPTGDQLVRLAARFQLPREVVEEVYTEDAGGLEISLHPGRLAPSKSAATRQITLLVTAQRQAAGEEQTAVDEIRQAAIEFGKYDAPNFSSAVNELRGAFLMKGPTRQRTLKLTRSGWAQAADLVRDLAGRG